MPRLPPKRDINFMINLMPWVAPVSKVPYRKSAPELIDVKMQLQEPLDKKYIRLSVSPCGAPILFIREKGYETEIVY